MQNPIHYNNTIYQKSLESYPDDYRGVKWESAESQFIRFKILCEISPLLFTHSVLDIGCGLGHLTEYLSAQNFKGQYKGIDLCHNMISLAQKKHPLFEFECNHIDNMSEASFDYVLASGIFAFVDFTQLQIIISALYQKARKGVAFNCLSPYIAESKKEAQLFYPNPTDVFDLCKRLTPFVTLRHDYLENDYTLYLYKM